MHPIPPPVGSSSTDRVPPLAAEKNLLLCRACKRQYDVTLVTPGERVRCECGAWLEVEAQRPRMPRPLLCGHCGGKLEVGAQRCAYCDAEITLEERGLSGVCPSCYARLLAGARYCMECGIAIQPQAVRAITDGVFCPRCGGTLQSRTVGAIALIECASCAGLWLAPDVFESICQRADQEAIVRQHLSSNPTPTIDATKAAAGYLPCIRCGDLMVRKNFGGTSGVIIDLCRGHGIWLDHRELERILDFVHGGGLARAREREVERLEARAARARDSLDTPTLLDEPRSPSVSQGDGSFLLEALRWIGAEIENRISI
jgi:Zn-finger nucleic acid-binding protein